VLAVASSVVPAAAQVVRDGSIGSLGAGTVATTIGPGGTTDYLIGEADGLRAGTNLFHSFSQFDLTSTERAVYQGSPTIQNLITRVTGGPSSIDGVIRSEIPGANLFFLNPAGVVFGENAQVDTTGAFYVSTADRLLFQGGDILETSLGGALTLSVDAVEGFGFLQAPAPIQIHGSQIQLDVNQRFAAIGGGIEILGNRADNERAFIDTQTGPIDLVSLASSGEVRVSVDGSGNDVVTLTGVTARGDVTIADGVTLNTSGIPRDALGNAFVLPNEGAGSVNVYANDLTIEDANIQALTVTDADAGDVVIDLDGDLVIRAVPGGFTSGILAGTGFALPRQPGDVLDPFLPFIFLASPTTSVTISNCTTGPCGLRYDADGQGGDVRVRAANARFEGGGRITARSENAGSAGNVELRVTDTISMSGVDDAGQRSGLSSTADDTGDPGIVLIDSPSARLVMEDRAAIVIQNTTSASAMGLIDIDVASLDMSGDARIDTSTRGSGPGGDISIDVSGAIEMRGRTSDTEFTGITTLSQPGSTGDAGDVEIMASSLSMRDGAEISARPVGVGALGDAGSLTIDIAEQIRLFDSAISTQSDAAGGGNIEIHYGDLLTAEYSAITSSVTTGSSPGGNVTILSDPGSALVLRSGRVVAQADAGAGGNILIETSLLLRDPESVISASSNSGIDGTVITRAPDAQQLDLGQELGTPGLDVSALIDEPCAARLPSGANSLVVASSDGLPSDLDSVLPVGLPSDVYARLGGQDDAPRAAASPSIEIAAVGDRPGAALLVASSRADRCLR